MYNNSKDSLMTKYYTIFQTDEFSSDYNKIKIEDKYYFIKKK